MKRAVVSMVIPITSPKVSPAKIVEAYTPPLRRAGHEFEFVFVLDGVHGAIVEELQDLARTGPVQVVRLHGTGLGESVALSAGVARARGEWIVNAPAYLQCEPDDVVDVVQALDSGADLVATWRHPRVDPWLNRLQSRFFNWCLRLLMGIHFHDLNSSLRGMRREVVEEVSVYGEMYRFLPVLAERQGYRVVEVKVRHREEQGRRGFYGVGVYLRRLLDILAITFLTRFRQKPLRFFATIGFLAIVIGVGMCAGPLYDKLVHDFTLQDRPLFVLGAIVIAFGVQLVGFGLVGEIVIFTQAGNLRDYKIEAEVDGGTEHVPELVDGEDDEAAGDPLRVRELLPGEDARWDAYVRRHPQGTFFHLTGWRRVVEETFGHEAHYLVVERGRRWAAALPLFFVRSPFLGKHLISVPYGVYGGVLSDGEESQRAALDAAVRHGRSLGAGYVELRHLGDRPGQRTRSDLYVTFRKELPAEPAAVLPAIPKKARAEVRRARDRHGMTIEESDDLDAFYALFCHDKRRLGSPTLPLRWFQALRDEFGRNVVLHVVRDGRGTVCAAVMSFRFGETLYAYYSGSHFEYRGTGLNDFLYCGIMEWAVADGCRVFDFGRSRRDTGAARFKKNMGFEPCPLEYEYLLLRDDSTLPDFHPSNPKLNAPRRLWSRLPMAVTTRLGGRLSRYLP